MVAICEYRKSWWLFVNTKNHGEYIGNDGKYLQLSFWQSRSMSLLEMYTDPQVFNKKSKFTHFSTFYIHIKLELGCYLLNLSLNHPQC